MTSGETKHVALFQGILKAEAFNETTEGHLIHLSSRVLEVVERSQMMVNRYSLRTRHSDRTHLFV